MAISKPFAYNPGGPISGTTQYGDIVVGNIVVDYSSDYGGVKWWGGPDEELGYVVGNARPGGQPVPAGVTGPAYVGFWRSQLLTDNSFLSLANYIGAQNSEPPFATTSAAVTWLNDNGYYTSYSGGTPVVLGYYVGGGFTEFSGITQNRLIRLNSDGSKDTSFDIGTGFDSSVFGITSYLSGTILISGGFYNYSGSGPNCLVRIDSQGNRDGLFNTGTGFGGAFGDEYVNPIVIDSNNKILVGGLFLQFNGSSQNCMVRLNSDGSKDTSFNIGSGFGGGNQSVETIAIDSGNKILAGGTFNAYQGASQNYLIRLNSDGSKDTSFNIGSGFNNSVNSTSIQSNGKILVGGYFTTFSGSSQNYLIRLNSDGSKDTSFDIGTGFDNIIFSIEVQSDGKILVGGFFTTFTGSSQNSLIRLNSDGSKDTTFDIGSGFDNAVYSLKVDSNGKVLVGGGFTTFTGSTQNGLIRLNSDGSKDTTFNIAGGFNSFIYSIKII